MRSIGSGTWAVFGVFGGYAVLYGHHVIGSDLSFLEQVSYFLGSCSVICMTLGMVLSARPRLIESGFGGLDRMYRLHKYLGVAALILFLAHFATLSGGGPDTEEEAAVVENLAGEEEEDEDDLPIDLLGMIAMIGFTSLIVLTLNRKIPYHRWLPTHRLTGLFYAVVGVHVLLALIDEAAFPLRSAPGGMLVLVLCAGLAAFVSRQLPWRRKGRHRFTVAAVHRLERATEVVLDTGTRVFDFEPGQFAFLTVDAPGFGEAHPFTISSGARENELRFTMKVAGDYTRRVREKLGVGGAARVEGPYGRFLPLKGRDQQVWIAGGIGITPFLSVMRTMEPGHGKTIRLYYGVRTEREALFFDELEARAAKLGGVWIRRFDSDAGARINVQAVESDLGDDLRDWNYYLCGPKPLVADLTAGLKARHVPARHIHNEEFELR